ncbi:hypothetical protein PG993_003952 [Apiospora rasikravindrae]|uniref:Uncharacterized protein n=1 Tax=Apiospora rasikravindrae TaxID=990691 RepID=A0ABR1U1I5_9PEZI
MSKHLKNQFTCCGGDEPISQDPSQKWDKSRDLQDQKSNHAHNVSRRDEKSGLCEQATAQNEPLDNSDDSDSSIEADECTQGGQSSNLRRQQDGDQSWHSLQQTEETTAKSQGSSQPRAVWKKQKPRI